MVAKNIDFRADALPVNWHLTSVSQIADVKGGKRLPKGLTLTDRPTSHPYIRVTDMRPGSVDPSDIRYVPSDVFPTIKNYRIFTNDIFISVAGTLGIVGKIPAILQGANLTENADRLTNIRCDQDYLIHYLSSDRIQRAIASARTLGAQPKLALGQIESFTIALPIDATEQRAIAKVLNEAEELVRTLDRLIAKKRGIKQAAMQQLLTGEKRLPGFQGTWLRQPLGELISRCFSGATPRRNRPENFMGPIPWITSGELRYKIINDTTEHISVEAQRSTNLKILPPGTFLMAITGLEAEGTRGSCGIVGVPATTNQSCMAVIPSSRILSEYLFHYYVLRGKQLALEYCQGTKQQSYTAAIVKLLPIEFPPTIEEQRAIAAVLCNMDSEIDMLEARRDKTRAIKQAMMQQLLTGKVRLV
jgi:type I restriction enzyme, S subunit